MDAAVQAAMARWPDVPDCYGWLHLDARGQWRIGPERAPIQHPGLRAFIGRNYAHDVQGNWFFQNGPQRVFASLEAAPWILTLNDCNTGLVTHTDVRVPPPESLWLGDDGRIYAPSPLGPASIDDRDLPTVLELLMAGARPDDPDTWVEAWQELAPTGRISTRLWDRPVSLCRFRDDPAIPLGFIRTPLPEDETR